jgi:hypothetical protein
LRHGIAEGILKRGAFILASYAVNQLIEVRFQVFFERAGGPVLSWCEVKDMFTPLSFASHGRQFASTEEMIAFLNGLGLPGEDIATPFNPEKSYFLTVAQMEAVAKP